jgi:surface carbohydrate biosynthesis protein
VNIYIKLEIETRELISRLLLGLYSASKGHQVFIGDDELLKLVQEKKLNPGIILEKSITPTELRIKQIEDYKANKSITTSIDEEGGLIRENLDIFLNSRFSEKTISLADKIFCWGKYDYEKLLTLFPKYKKKFVITGNPRINLWSKKYKNLFSLPNIKNKKYVLISANFGIGVSTKRLSEIFKFHIENNYFDNKEYEEDFVNIQNYNLKLLFKFVSAINYVTKRFPNLNFLIRPHPTESIKSWKNFFNEKKNLKISKDLTHSDWIENSDIIIHNGCTAGVEAFARDKKIISFEPIKDKSDFNDFPNKFGYTATNEIELGNIIEKIHDVEINEKVDQEHLNQFIYRFNNYENENFAKNISNEWSKFDNKELSKKNNLIVIKLINKLRLFKNIFIKPYFNEKFPPLDKAKIINIINKLKKIDHSLNNIHFELIGPKLFKLSLIK